MQDTQQDHTGMKAAVAAISCVCTKTRSGKLSSVDISIPDQSTVRNI